MAMSGEGRGFFAQGVFAAEDQPELYQLVAMNMGNVSELPPPQNWL